MAAVIVLPLILQPAIAYGANGNSPFQKITHSLYCSLAGLFNPAACEVADEQLPPIAVDKSGMLAAPVSASLPLRAPDIELPEQNEQPAPQIIQPVVERTVHTREIVRESGITQNQFDVALNDLRRQIANAQAVLPASYGAPVARSMPNTWGLTQRIDNLNGVDFSNGTITGTPITNSPISGSTGSFTDFLATSATSTNLYATSLTALSGLFTNATTTDFVAMGTSSLSTLTVSGNTSLTGSFSVTGTTTLASTTLSSALHDASGSAGTSGHVLTSTGTSTAWSTIGGSSITTDSLDWSEFADTMTLDANTTIDMDTSGADLNFDSNTFVIDSSTNRVGIGTAAPARLLHIQSADETYLRISNSDNGDNTGIEFLGAGTRATLYAGGDARLHINGGRSDGSTDIHINDTSSGDVSMVQGGGNVGIGTGTATYKLSVVDNTDHYFATLIQNQSNYGHGLKILAGTQAFNRTLLDVGANDNSSIFVVKGNGNVGVGDTSPAAALTVGSGDLFQVNSSGAIAAATGITSSGTINFSSLTASRLVATDASKNLSSTITEANLESSISDASNIFTNNDTITTANIADSYLLNTGDTATGDYNFDSDTLVIDSNTNSVGIGTSTPDAPLTVQTSITDGNIQSWKDSSGTTRLYIDTKSSMTYIYSGDNGVGSSGITLRSTNNSPTTIAAHNGAININPGPYDGSNNFSFTGGGTVSVNVWNNTSASKKLSSRLALGLYDEANSLGQIWLRPAYAESLQGGLIIKAQTNGSSFVGVGTTAPEYELDIQDSGSDGIPLNLSGGGSSLGATIQQTHGNRSWQTGVSGGGGGVYGASGTWFLRDQTAGAIRAVVDTSGNVGIGTKVPWQKLSVKAGSSEETIASFGYSSTQGRVDLGLTGWHGRADIYNASNIKTVSLNSAGDSYLTGGNVGIGTASPGYKLDVYGGQARFRQPSNATTTIFLQHGNDNSPDLKYGEIRNRIDGTDGGSAIRLGQTNVESSYVSLIANNSEVLRATSDKIGIGTSSPADKLDIAGDIRVGTGTTGCVKDADGTSIAGTCSSDERLKTDITNLPGILNNLVKLQPVSYHWNETAAEIFSYGTSSEQIGLIAQQVEAHLPALVTEDAAGYKQIRFSDLPIYLLKGMREMWAVVTGNRDDIAALKSEVAALKAQLAASGTSQPVADNDNSPTPEPTIELRGNDPAQVALNATYSDLGVIAKDANGNDLSVSLRLDGEPVEEISLDTSTSTTHIITYSAVTQDDITLEITRTVIVGDPEEAEAEDTDAAEPEATEAENATDKTVSVEDENTDTEENPAPQDQGDAQEEAQEPEVPADETASTSDENEPVADEATGS